MKICVIPPDQREPHPAHVTSGQERVARDQARLLVQAGHHVDYWTVQTDNDLSVLGFNHEVMPNVYPRAYFDTDRPPPQLAQKKAWVQQHAADYDIFLVHADSTVFLKELTREGYAHRVISFIHAPHAGTTWGDGFHSGQGRAKWDGATIVAVSQRCADHWNKWSAQMHARLKGGLKWTRPDLINLDIVHERLVTEVLCPQFSSCTDKVKPSNGRPVVLSRISKEKALHRAFGVGATFIVRSDDPEYEESVAQDLKHEKVLRDLPHAECMKRLAEAHVLISTWTEETSGINAFEAAERGVPVILCENVIPHASRDFLPEWAYITCEPTENGVRAALERLPKEWGTIEFRQRLASHMRLVWTEAAYQKKLNALVSRVHRDFKLRPIIKKAFGGEKMVEVDLQPELSLVLEATLNAASESQDHEMRLAWAEPQYRELKNELNIRLVELTDLYRQKHKGTSQTGIYIMLLNDACTKKANKPIKIGEKVRVQVMAYNGPELRPKLPRSMGEGLQWQKWQCLWVAGSTRLVDFGPNDLRNLTRLVNDAVTTCYQPVKRAINKL